MSSQNNVKPNGPFDVIVVGAGPCGATAAYFLSSGMEGLKGKNVALLDRATFPRDKFCGDAWCAPALDLLEEMQVLQQLEADGLVQDCTSGGFVSPSGESYISAEVENASNMPSAARTYAIKRKICDEAIVRRAQAVGANLFENADCESAKLESDGLWSVKCRDGRIFRSKMLIAADGAASNLSRSLGIVTTAPDGTASRQYVKGGTHNFKSGGVLFYPDYAIPGYVAIFRHYDDDIDIGVYLIKGGATPPENILDVAIDGVANDPFMQRLIGPNAVALERPRVASLRTGGEKQSSSTQFMAVGDAAGQTDPLTGEGIHTGMIGAKLAALTIHEMYEQNDFSAKACRVYHQRWWKAFGKDFPASAMAAKMTYRMPLLLDAASVVAQRKGMEFIEDFGAAMTGVKPKTTFLKPSVSIPVTLEIFRQAFIQKVLRPFKSVREAYDARAVMADNRADSFHQSGLKNAQVEARPIALQAGTQDGFEKLYRFQLAEKDARRLHIISASEYGFADDLAEELAELLFEQGKQAQQQALDIRLMSAEHIEVMDWQEVDTCLFLCSTAGDGDAPHTLETFLEQLEEGIDLKHLNFSVLALGDSAYPNFCAAGLKLETLLQKNNANCIVPLVKVNAESRSDIEIWQKAVSALVLDNTYWSERNNAVEEDLWARAENYFAYLAPPTPGSSARMPVDVKVMGRNLIGDASKGGTETFSVMLSTEFNGQKTLDWQSGDALGVFPENPAKEVESVLALIPFNQETEIELPAKRGKTTFFEAIGSNLDIKNLSSNFWPMLEQHIHSGEQEAFLSRENKKNFELQDVLKAFPETMKAISAQALADALGVLQPRYYSIASSKQFDEKHLELAIARMDFEIEGEQRVGVASHFLNHQLAVGASLKVFVQKNKHFRLPAADSGLACVMIGAGTGVAPYKAFMQELGKREAGKRKHLLFFGCKHEQADFLYQEDWKNWQSKLDCFTAFSRDQSEKIYVQHRLKEQGALVWQAIEAGDHFYICGDATRMAVDVENALLDIICEQSQCSLEAARTRLKEMSQASRYQKDVWV